MQKLFAPLLRRGISRWGVSPGGAARWGIASGSGAALCLSLALTPVFAADSWTGQDKGLHFAGSAGLSLVITHISQDPALGFWSAIAAGAAKELADRNGRGDPSMRDFTVDIAGAYLGSQTGGWMLYKSGKTTGLGKSWQF